MVGTITSVEESHLEHGLLADCRKCPVALAMLDGAYDNPVVDYSKISYFKFENNLDNEITKNMTKELRRLVENIDMKMNIKPFKIIERKDNFSVYKGE